MLAAIDPKDGKQISIEDYLTKYGDDHHKPEFRAICPFCGGKMNVRRSVGATEHFYHLKGSLCPLTSNQERQLRKSLPKNPDAKHAAMILEKFKNNWEFHYKKLNKMIPFLKFDEFRKILVEAKKARIWFYSKLEEYQLTYIFASLIDFHPRYPESQYSRKYHFRFIFCHSMNTYDDLIGCDKENVICKRASFKPLPNGESPRIDEFIKFEPFEYSDSSLGSEGWTIKKPKKDEIVAFLKKYSI